VSTAAGSSMFKQPKAVYAVAFACVVSFMGIGLVDPILPALSVQLHATPSQVSLLFTSYLVVTAVAMLFTGWVSSRIGAKRTLITGLAIIVVFSALAGLSGSIGGIVGFRAGWGLGNALFIATSLAVIVASATGGFAGAIVLYEAALGLGIAAGPLVGGLLGNISWRGPFFGVAVLMAIALLATVVLLDPTPTPTHRTSLTAPLKALRHRSLLTMSVTALLYNWGFFTMLGYAPYPMELDAVQLGFVFFGWGLLVAFFAVIGAPRLQARFGTAPSLYGALGFFAVLLLLIGLFTDVRWALIVCVIASGIVVGINNTLTTQAVMLVSPVERPVASAAYGFVRFIGGGLAPFAAGKLAEHFNLHVPFLVGAVAVAAGIGVLATGHRMLSRADADMAGHGVSEEDIAGEVADEFGGASGAIDDELQVEAHARS
jgi:MFS transporter, ACDE family, multidrug resistance protein